MRKIDMLRKEFGGKWRYEFPSRWIGPNFEVQGYSKLSGFMEDDYSTEYRRSDTQEVFLFLPSDFLK